MRILVLAALYPPEFLGGAEISAANLSRWLARQGHDVTVLATARSRDEECRDVLVDGVRLWRLRTPHLYPMISFPEASGWKKPFWHLQDHFDPRNIGPVRQVLDAVRPDFVNIHILQGLGHNTLRILADRRVPTLYVLHDLGLACIRMTMRRPQGSCVTACAVCRFSGANKMRWLQRFERIGFLSPSAANLATLQRFLPLDAYPRAIIPNANLYPRPTVERERSAVPRLLFVGRLHAAKGIDVLLDAAEAVARRQRFRLDVVGGGPDEAALHRRYGHHDWLTFHGAVSELVVGNRMQNADLLCVPSSSHENWPGVIVRALGLGLPVLASDIGGIPELVAPGRNGSLVTAGDPEAWRHALDRILEEPGQIDAWRSFAEAKPTHFDQDELGRRILAFMETIASAPGRAAGSSPSHG